MQVSQIIQPRFASQFRVVTTQNQKVYLTSDFVAEAALQTQEAVLFNAPNLIHVADNQDQTFIDWVNRLDVGIKAEKVQKKGWSLIAEMFKALKTN